MALFIGYALSVSYNIMAVVGVWRSAEHYEGPDIHRDFARMATVMLMAVLSLTYGRFPSATVRAWHSLVGRSELDELLHPEALCDSQVQAHGRRLWTRGGPCGFGRT